MDAQDTAGLSRRDVLKRSAVVGGLVWMAPTILAGPASASVVTCPASRRYAIKHGSPDTRCEVPGANPGRNPGGTGNCAAAEFPDGFQDGCCLEPDLVSFVISDGGRTHTYTLAPGVGFSQGFAKCASVCYEHEEPHNPFVSEVRDEITGITTVIMTCPDLSHSELVVCIDGSRPPSCP